MELIKKDESPELLFVCELEEALAKQSVCISDDARAYVTGLLLKILDNDGISLTCPLAPKFLEAINEVPGRFRDTLLQRVGNSALLLCGIWWQSVEYAREYKHGIDRQYHESIGTYAYRMIDKDLFLELSDNFINLAYALARVGSSSHFDDDRHTLRLYEYWLRTQNEIAKMLLLSQGVVLEGSMDLKN